MGAFDHLEWTYDGAFEQLFGLGRGEFEQKFCKKYKCRGVARGGMLKLRFDWYITRKKLVEQISISTRRPQTHVSPPLVVLVPSARIVFKMSLRPGDQHEWKNKGGKFLKKLWCCVGGSITR